MKTDLWKRNKLMERGFTFLEMLLVLSLAGLLAALSLFNMLPLYEARKLDRFMEQFEEDILFMQQAALSTSKTYQMRWLLGQHSYKISESGGGKSVITRVYDAGLRVELRTLANPLVYGADGNVNRGGTVYVSYGSKTYRVVFYLGQGRFNTYPE